MDDIVHRGSGRKPLEWVDRGSGRRLTAGTDGNILSADPSAEISPDGGFVADAAGNNNVLFPASDTNNPTFGNGPPLPFETNFLSGSDYLMLPSAAAAAASDPVPGTGIPAQS